METTETALRESSGNDVVRNRNDKKQTEIIIKNAKNLLVRMRSAVRIRPSLQCLIKEYRVMTRFFQFVIVGIILGAVLMLLASIVSSCYFFITTFTLSDFEERTASFVLGAVSALFTYGMFRILMNALQAFSDKLDAIKKRYESNN